MWICGCTLCTLNMKHFLSFKSDTGSKACYGYSWPHNCAWILSHISVKWVCAHLMSITYLMAKLKKNMFQILFILHTAITNYKTFGLPLECKNQAENHVLDDQDHHTDFVSKILLQRLWLMCQRTARLYRCFSCDWAVCNYLWNLGCCYCIKSIYCHHTKLPKVNKSRSSP